MAASIHQLTTYLSTAHRLHTSARPGTPVPWWDIGEGARRRAGVQPGVICVFTPSTRLVGASDPRKRPI